MVHALEKQEGDEGNPSKTHFWLVNILQFFFGGILSTYLVFYFRSSDIAVSWPFLLILGLCFWANESLKRQFVRLAFQISIFFLSILCFAIYLVPILAHHIGRDMFLFAGVMSLLFIGLFLLLVRITAKKEFEQSKKIVYLSIGGIFILVNALYFSGLIPPLPLSLKDAGVYYGIKRSGDGQYVALAPAKGNSWFNLYPAFYRRAGQPVYVYTAVFSPEEFNMNVIHEWQNWQAENKQWTTVNRINLPVVGGRDGGFRTYSLKTLIQPGRWRVNVLTEEGQLVGRVRFDIKESAGETETVSVVK